MDTFIFILDVVLIVLVIILLVLLIKIAKLVSGSGNSKILQSYDSIVREVRDSRGEIRSILSEQRNENLNSTARQFEALSRQLDANNDNQNRMIANSFNTMNSSVNKVLEHNNTNIVNRLIANDEKNKEILNGNTHILVTNLNTLQKTMESRLDLLTRNLTESYAKQQTDLNNNFTALRTENTRQLDLIRENVNEKLDKTLNEQFDKNFKGVIEQMSNLQVSMGELKSLSGQVGNLEKSLNGIKTRGIMGENQLSLLISDILAPNQYEEQIATIPGSRDFVEIALRIPRKDNGEYSYLPIDSKCHVEPYLKLAEARNSGDKAAIDAARKEFADEIVKDAKSIRSKYIKEPYTTPYGILFVPFESMYSEIVELDLIEVMNQMQITVAGPYTLSAILSTVRNYWQMMAVENKSREIQATLANTKKAFEQYTDVAVKLRKNLDQASKNLDELDGVRTRAINKALRNVDASDDLLLAEANLGIKNVDD